MSIPIKRPSILCVGKYEKVEPSKDMEAHHKCVLYLKSITLSNTILNDTVCMFPMFITFSSINVRIFADGSNVMISPKDS